MKHHLIIYILLLFLLGSISARAQKVPWNKLSPSLRAFCLEKNEARANKSLAKSKEGKNPLVCVFIKVNGDADDVLRANDVIKLASFDDIFIASIPVSRIYPLASDSRIRRIEMARSMRTTNDQNTKWLNVNDAYKGTNLPQAFTGKGVVMGIEDIGFDLTNPNFYSSDMSEYRIKSLWDMLSTDTIGSKYYVGNAYEGRDVLLSYAHSRDGLLQCHGSHTLGTAAGSGYGTAYRGVAFDSDICLVSNATSDNEDMISDDDKGKYTYATDALGFKYIFDYAQSVGKPCVISFSEGSAEDLYGDDILYDEILSKLIGPGKILVSAAGNSSLEPNYIHKAVGQASVGTFLEKWTGPFYFFTTGVRDYTTRLVFYSEKNDTIHIPTDWLCQQKDSIYNDTLQVGDDTYTVAVGSYPDCYDKEKFVTEIYVSGPEHMGMGKTPISMEVIGADTETETYKVSGNFVSKPNNPDLHDGVVAKNILSPGSLSSVICVGATAYRTGFTNMAGEKKTYNNGENGVKADFSSVGPTLDGRIKPDVMAPGANIISSTNSFYFEENPDSDQVSSLVGSYEYNGRRYYWKSDAGTSMSSPAVGGAIALWLQAKPTLTKDDILDVFAHTCNHTADNLSYPNNEYGYGQIDVYRGLLYILGMDGIEGISQNQPEKISFRILGNGCFEVVFPEPVTKDTKISIYDTSGCLFQVAIAEKGECVKRISLRTGLKGVIAVQVDGNTPETQGSTLLRL